MNQYVLFVAMAMLAMLVGCQNAELQNEEFEADRVSTNVLPEDWKRKVSCELEESNLLHNFTENEVRSNRELLFYEYDEAAQLGEVTQMEGELPGAFPGIWYIISLDGVEYYYGKYDGEEEITLFSYAMMDASYELSCGIHVGMSAEDILNQYPDMAVVNWETPETAENEVSGFMGWNSVTYPRATNQNYQWQEQYDYALVAEVKDLDLPRYIALMMKDDRVSAITFYLPTAG